MKDYGLGPLVEGKALFNQNVQQIKKKVVMNVQLKTLSSILLLLGTHLSDDLWSRKVSSEQHEKVVLKKVSLIEHSLEVSIIMNFSPCRMVRKNERVDFVLFCFDLVRMRRLVLSIFL